MCADRKNMFKYCLTVQIYKKTDNNKGEMRGSLHYAVR